MKRILCFVLLSVSFIVSGFAQAVNEVTLTMVDGVEANVYLFKDWKTANKFINENKPVAASVSYTIKDGNITVKDSRKSKGDWILSPVGFTAKNENEPGDLINKNYKETYNEVVSKICETFKDNECSYGISFADLGDKYVRYILYCKKDKLRVNRYCYYSESNQDYQAFIKKQLAKDAKMQAAIDNFFNSLATPTKTTGDSKYMWNPGTTGRTTNSSFGSTESEPGKWEKQ